MEAAITFEASKREKAGKGEARALRREGKLPAVVYGDNKAAVSIALDANTVTTAYRRGGFFSSLIEINAGGDKMMVLPKDIQLHPVSDAIEHIDFVNVNEKSKINVIVPVKVVGRDRSVGLRRGGALNVVRHDLELVCSPNNIPKSVELDVTKLNIGESVHISHITLPEGVEPAIADRDFTIATITGRGKKADKADEATAEGTEEAAAA